MANMQRSSRFMHSLGIRVILVKEKRLLSSTVVRYYSDEQAKKQTFFQKLWDRGNVLPHTDAHSKTLTSNVATYEFQFESVKPEYMEEYLTKTSEFNVKLSQDDTYPGVLVGSWNTLFGSQDQAVHLWVYKDGYKGISEQLSYSKENEELKAFNREKNKWLQSRESQLCQEFSFWGEPRPRKKSHIYELRSYSLKPGTLIEWGNKWSTAINIRRKDAVAGFFSQVGELYMVHHIWAYYDMQHRKEERERMWQIPGWDDCVAATVPLIRHMRAGILIPTSSSPLQ